MTRLFNVDGDGALYFYKQQDQKADSLHRDLDLPARIHKDYIGYWKSSMYHRLACDGPAVIYLKFGLKQYIEYGATVAAPI